MKTRLGIRSASPLVGVALGLTLVLGACSRDAGMSSGMTTTTGATVARNDAISRVVKARCEREAECNLFGSGNQRECMNEYVQRPTTTRLGACPHGIDNGRLNMCLADLERQQCQEEMGPISDFAHCTRSMCAP